MFSPGLIHTVYVSDRGPLVNWERPEHTSLLVNWYYAKHNVIHVNVAFPRYALGEAGESKFVAAHQGRHPAFALTLSSPRSVPGVCMGMCRIGATLGCREAGAQGSARRRRKEAPDAGSRPDNAFRKGFSRPDNAFRKGFPPPR